MAAIATFNLDLLPPAEMSIDLAGMSIESDRSLSGITSAIDYSGGGYWTCKYKKLQIYSPMAHRYFNQLRNQLNGGVRNLPVPLLTDWIAPVTKPGNPLRILTSHSDGSPLSDATLYSQSAIQAVLGADAGLAAGTVVITVGTGGTIMGGETFAINHPTKGWRCYGISDVDAVTKNGDGTVSYTVGIRPTLREATLGGTTTEFARPRCTMRLMPGTSLSWDVRTFWQSLPDIEFIEAFI